MEDLKDVHFTPMLESRYVKPLRFNYTQNGKKKAYDLLEVPDSVAILIFNITRKVITFVKQFRPAIYYNSVPVNERLKAVDTEKFPASLGLALEMCAGNVDKNKPLKEIAQEEVLEECGYDVPLSGLEQVASYRSGVGVQGSMQTLFYCEVTDAMKTQQGGGIGDEIIDVVEMKIPQAEQYVLSPGPLASPPSCLFALMWFIHYKADKYRKSYERTCGECKAEIIQAIRDKEDNIWKRQEIINATMKRSLRYPRVQPITTTTENLRALRYYHLLYYNLFLVLIFIFIAV